MNSIKIGTDTLNYTPESGFTYTDSFGEVSRFETAGQFREWFATETGGMALDDDVENFISNPW